jgi:hypothetical protein
MLALSVSACTTITSAADLIPSFLFNSLQTTLLNALIVPTISANAGANQVALTNARIILDGSASGVVSGSGTVNTAPTPALTYAWAIVASPITDQNGDGQVNATDFAAAGVRLDLATTANPQFLSPVAGAYQIQLTVGWTTPQGLPISGTSTVNLTVFTPAP